MDRVLFARLGVLVPLAGARPFSSAAAASKKGSVRKVCAPRDSSVCSSERRYRSTFQGPLQGPRATWLGGSLATWPNRSRFNRIASWDGSQSNGDVSFVWRDFFQNQVSLISFDYEH